MTINANIVKSGPYTGTATADTYAYDFKVLASSEIVVRETTDLGVESILVEGTDYSVTGVGNNGGGTVVRTAGNLPNNYTWLIWRDTADTQVTDFTSQGAFLPVSHENALDKLTNLVQELQDKVNRSFRVEIGGIDLTEFPFSPAGLSGKVAQFSALGDIAPVLPSVILQNPSASFASLANIGTLQANTISTISSVFVEGHTAAGDGGGGWFVKDPADTTSLDNGVTIIVDAQTPTAARWKRTFENAINIKYFGAKVDGATDDSTVLETAVNSGFPLYFPNGTYLLSTIGSKTFTKAINWTGESKYGVTFDGNLTESISTTHDPTKIYCRQIHFTQFVDALTTPFSTTRTVEDLDVADCRFTAISEKAINIGPDIINRASIQNNQFETIGGANNCAAIHVGLSSSVANEIASQDTKQRYIITGNHIKDVVKTTNGGDAHGIIVWGRKAIIADNVLENIHNNDYSAGSEGIYTKARFVTISDNLLFDAGWNQGSILMKGAARGVGTSGEGHSNEVEGNVIIFSNVTNDSIGIYVKNSDLLIHGNRIENATRGITVDEAVDQGDLRIYDNEIYDSELAGIHLADYNGAIDIHNNVIRGITGVGQTNVWGIYIFPGAAIQTVRCIDNRVLVESTCAASTEIRGIQIFPNTGFTLAELQVNDNHVDINNSTLHRGIRLNFADVTNAEIIDNKITLSSGIQANEISIANTSRPTLYKIVNNGNYPDESNAENQGRFTTAFRYRFTDGAGPGNVTIGYLPLNAVVTKAYYHVAIAPLPTSSTGALSIFTDDTDGIKAVTLFSDASWAIGYHDAIQDGAIANFSNKVTATAREVQMKIAGGALTAGDLTLYLEYVIQQG